jgi:Ca-activated chloride channel family protein
VTDVYPQRLPDLFNGKPLVVTGRYAVPAAGSIRLHGKRAGADFVREIPVTLATNSSQHDVLAGFWARRRIDDLMSQDWGGMQSGNVKPEVQKEITQLGLEYRLMTQFTSFVAVEDRVVTKDGNPQRVEVPVEMPEGVSYEGVFGDEKRAFLGNPNAGLYMYSQLQAAPSRVIAKSGTGSGHGAGVGVGSAGGVMGRVIASPKPGPPPPPAVAIPKAGNQPTVVETKLSPERKALESKLHPALLAAFDCAVKAQQECKLVDAGKIEVQVFLTQNSANVVDQLRKLGFEPAEGHGEGKILKGRLPVEKLQAFAQIAEVRFVSPIRR